MRVVLLIGALATASGCSTIQPKQVVKNNLPSRKIATAPGPLNCITYQVSSGKELKIAPVDLYAKAKKRDTSSIEGAEYVYDASDVDLRGEEVFGCKTIAIIKNGYNNFGTVLHLIDFDQDYQATTACVYTSTSPLGHAGVFVACSK